MRTVIAMACMITFATGCGELPGQAGWGDTDRNGNGCIGICDDGLFPQVRDLPLGESTGGVTQSHSEQWYSIELKAEQTLEVEITFEHKDGNLDLTMVSGAQDFFNASVTETDREFLAVTAPQDDTYIVVVAGLFGDSNRYRMNARVLEPGQAGCAEAAERPVTRLSNRLDQTVWTYGRHCKGSESVYEVELNLGEDLELSLMFDHRRGQINLEVHGPDGELVLTGDGAPALKDAKLEGVLPGVYTVKVKGGAMDMPFIMSSKVVDPCTTVIELDSICGDIEDSGVTLTGRGDRVYMVEVQECSSWPEKMTLHVRLQHPGPEDYDLVAIYGQDIVDHTADDRLDFLELTHSSWSWGATNRTYLITVVRKQHDPEIETHPKWTLDLRGYTADW